MSGKEMRCNAADDNASQGEDTTPVPGGVTLTGNDAFFALMSQAAHNRLEVSSSSPADTIRNVARVSARLFMALSRANTSLTVKLGDKAGEGDSEKRKIELFCDLVVKACFYETKGDLQLNESWLQKIREILSDDPTMINKPASFEDTPLHTACGSAAPRTLQFLLSYQPNPLTKNCFDQTPMCRLWKYAKQNKGAQECATLMMKYLSENRLTDDTASANISEYGPISPEEPPGESSGADKGIADEGIADEGLADKNEEASPSISEYGPVPPEKLPGGTPNASSEGSCGVKRERE